MAQSSSFDNLLMDVFASLQYGVKSLRDRGRNFFMHYMANVSASQENYLLKNKILELEKQVFQAQEIQRENERLRTFLKLGRVGNFGKVLAQVVAWDSNSDYKVLRINKGSGDGVRMQAPVITADGLVGYVYRLTDHFSDILTILDSNNRVDGIIQRTRCHGIVEGSSSFQATMKYVSRTEPVILKDQAITSGLGNIYPKGIKIGMVTRIEKESYGIIQEVTITPAVDFRRLEEVVVLVGKRDERKKQEWEALNKLNIGRSGDSR